MNKVILIGRLTRNPDVRYSQNENSLAVARFTLAVDRRFKRDNEATADFISCVAFGRTAEFFEKYTHQGSKMAIEGRIQTGSYVKQDGTKVYTTDVVVENAEFADSKAAGAGMGNAPAAQGQNFQQPSNPQGFQNSGYGSNSFQGQNQNGYYSGQAASAMNQGFDTQNAGVSGFQGMSYGAQSYDSNNQNHGGFSQQEAPMQEAADEGFMQIPDELNDEGLPFG